MVTVVTVAVACTAEADTARMEVVEEEVVEAVLEGAATTEAGGNCGDTRPTSGS